MSKDTIGKFEFMVEVIVLVLVQNKAVRHLKVSAVRHSPCLALDILIGPPRRTRTAMHEAREDSEE
jgi:hypothetical protein